MRDHLILYVNGRRHTVRGADCWLTLSEYLRRKLGMVGTKIVCSEGDCGSCTVLVGRPRGDRLHYRPIDSCIAFLFQLDGRHVVTVEGIGEPDRLSPVQQSLVGCHASQCGFCTPGFVMAMTGLLEENRSPTEADWRTGLTGNLCRCTGYVSIFEAGQQLSQLQVNGLNNVYPPASMLRDLGHAAKTSIAIDVEQHDQPGRLFSPTSLAEAVEVLAQHPSATVVAGATDVGVQVNKDLIAPAVMLDLNRIAELEGASTDEGPDGPTLVAGALARWSEIEALCQEHVPEFARIISVFGSPQIRHMGTLGGNVINASPIADSLPFLLVMEAELELRSTQGTRFVPITSFYRGYKQLDLLPGELLVRIRIPVPDESQALRLYKVSRRRDLDISTFAAAILMALDGDCILSSRLAFGGVGPTVIRARKTEAFLNGKLFDEDTMRVAGQVAACEISPISDVRGGADYRLQLTRNALLKYFYERRDAALPVDSYA